MQFIGRDGNTGNIGSGESGAVNCQLVVSYWLSASTIAV